VLRCSDKHKPRVMAVPAGWKSLAIDAGDFVIPCVSRVVDHFIDTGVRNIFTRLEFISNLSHMAHYSLVEPIVL
jgi:hypothetical protein